MASPDGKPEDLVYQKPDGSLLTRLEMDQQMREKWRKVHWIRIQACKQPFHLQKQFSFDMKEIVLRHWVLDEMCRQGMIVGDLAHVNLQTYNDEAEQRQFIQRLTALIQAGQAISPSEGEGVDMSNIPGNGQPPQPPQAFTPPAPPQMGAPQQFVPPQPQQFQPPQPPQPPPPQQFTAPQQAAPPMPPGYAGPPQVAQQSFAPPQPQQQFAPPVGMPMQPPTQAQAAPPAGGRRRKAADQPPAPVPQAAPVPPMGPHGYAPPQAQPAFAPPAPAGVPMPGAGYAPPAPQQQFAAPAPVPQVAPPQAAQVDLSPLIQLIQQQAQQISELGRQVQMANMAITVLSRAYYQRQGNADVEAWLKEMNQTIPQ